MTNNVDWRTFEVKGLIAAPSLYFTKKVNEIKSNLKKDYYSIEKAVTVTGMLEISVDKYVESFENFKHNKEYDSYLEQAEFLKEHLKREIQTLLNLKSFTDDIKMVNLLDRFVDVMKKEKVPHLNTEYKDINEEIFDRELFKKL